MAATSRIKGITIEINGDSSKLTTALSKVDGAIRETQSNLRDIDRALQLDPGNTELLKDRQQELSIQIDETKRKIETEKEALDQLRQTDGFDENSRQAQNLKTQIDLDTAALKDLERQSKDTTSVFSQQMTIMGNKVKAVGDKVSGVGRQLSGLGRSMTTRLTVPIVAAGTASVKMASDYEENLNKVDVAFNDSADTVKEWAKTATTQFGLSENSALEAAALFGDMGTSMGLSDQEAADMAVTLTGLAGDLSSFKNIGIDQAMTALKSVFTGETESLKNLGVVMTQTNLEEFADKTGRVYKEMSQAEKVALRYEYVLASTQNAQGDYARTSDGTANSIRTMQASAENLAVVFGQEILPYITPLIQGLTQLINEFASLDEETKQNIITALGVIAALGPILTVIGTLVTAIGGIISAVGTLTTAFGAISAAAPAIGTALAAIGAALTGPIGIIAAIIAALFALGVAIYANWDKIKAFCADVAAGFERLKADVIAKWNEIKTNIANKVNEIKTNAINKFVEIKTKITDTFSNLKNSITSTVGNIKNAIVNGFQGAVNFIKSLPQKALTWGRDMIQNFVNGIWDKIGSVTDAISGVADRIAGFLHFSEPDEGPLSNFHTFAPDMVKLFAQGITQSLPMLEKAADQMAGVIANDATATIQGGQTAASKTVNAPISINVYGAAGQDVNQLADIIQQKMNRAVVNQKAVFA